MLVAHDPAGQPIEASRDLVDSEFRCPTCDWPVQLKRGRVKVAHFAHLPGAECWSEPESVTHLRAKQLLAARFRLFGYQVRLEEVHHQAGRRVDVAATVPTSNGPPVRVAVEVQDSAIAVEEMKSRTRIDRNLGFLGTVWVFTDKRARAVLALADGDIETRIPKELLWVDNRFRQGVFMLDVDAEEMWNVTLSAASTRYPDWDDGFGYTPKTLRYPKRRPASFALNWRPGRYANEWAIVFTRT